MVMKVSSISYSATVEGLCFGKHIKLKISTKDSEIQITIKTEYDSQLLLDLSFQKPLASQRAFAVAERTAERILDQIAFEYNSNIGKLNFLGVTNIDDDDDGKSSVYTELGAVYDISSSTITIPEQNIDKLQKKLEKPVLRFDSNIHFYRLACRETNHIARFMLFYSILLQFFDWQKRIEQEIIRQHKVYRSKLGKLNYRHRTRTQNGKLKLTKETVYTRLRNEIAHGRDAGFSLKKTPYKKIDDDIKHWVGPLREIAKQVILDKS